MSEENSTEPNLDYQGGRPTVREAHDSVRREKPDPVAGGSSTLLISWLVAAGIIVFMAGGYFDAYSNSFDRSDLFVYPNYVAEPRPLINGVPIVDDRTWIEAWMDDGKKVFNNCIACHQASGLGVPGQFPPLKGSEWVNGGTERLGMIVLSGVGGPFTVSGSTYNQVMQPWGALSDEKLAQVLTYVRRTFGEFGEMTEGKSGVVTTAMMQAARKKHGGRTTQWTENELLDVKEDAELPGEEVDLITGKPLSEIQDEAGAEEGEESKEKGDGN